MSEWGRKDKIREREREVEKQGFFRNRSTLIRPLIHSLKADILKGQLRQICFHRDIRNYFSEKAGYF